ncbi:MAG: hypothetical protein FWD11_05935 [Micrococcales bacterium]|nr:hypothetical protein [Micrococcales bacterium]
MRSDRLEKAFLAAPGRPHRWRTTSLATERSLLRGTHPLSPGLTVLPHVVDRDKHPAGRCALILPTGGQTAFVGFFECIDSQIVADRLFAWARDTAQQAGYHELVGPVDASFWLGYRMKMDAFEAAPYLGEPYNPSYHPRLWTDAGWQVTQRYSSTFFRVPSPDYAVERYDDRWAAAKARGYRVEPLDPRRWDEVLGKVHGLVMRLYADMPYFHPLSAEQFAAMFGGLRLIAPADLTTLVWRDDDLAGFTIVLPDYGDLPNRRLGPATLGRILWTRGHHHRVVAAYMGAAEPGLGSAMAVRVIEQACRGQLQMIGSLIAEGTPSELYSTEMVADRRHYALWSTSV